MSQERLTISVDEAASLLGISRSAAYDCVKTGELPSIRMGRRVLIPLAVLQRLVEEAA
ncbi:MAG: excisionase family DNA-binding protein [Actinomycetia bacterium]|nr:excisionase family DNA-binding protein [Actinomycetes bacterium]